MWEGWIPKSEPNSAVQLAYGSLNVTTATFGLVASMLSMLPIRLASRLGAAFGSLALYLAPGERRKALESLRIALPEQSEGDRRSLSHETFRHLGPLG